MPPGLPEFRSTEVLSEEAAEAARKLDLAHRNGDREMFHFYLGQLWSLAELIYAGNIREGKA